MRHGLIIKRRFRGGGGNVVFTENKHSGDISKCNCNMHYNSQALNFLKLSSYNNMKELKLCAIKV